MIVRAMKSMHFLQMVGWNQHNIFQRKRKTPWWPVASGSSWKKARGPSSSTIRSSAETQYVFSWEKPSCDVCCEIWFCNRTNMFSKRTWHVQFSFYELCLVVLKMLEYSNTWRLDEILFSASELGVPIDATVIGGVYPCFLYILSLYVPSGMARLATSCHLEILVSMIFNAAITFWNQGSANVVCRGQGNSPMSQLPVEDVNKGVAGIQNTQLVATGGCKQLRKPVGKKNKEKPWKMKPDAALRQAATKRIFQILEYMVAEFQWWSNVEPLYAGSLKLRHNFLILGKFCQVF